MDFWVGGIFKLLGNDRAGGFGDDFIGLGDGALHAGGAGGQHQFRAEQGQHLAALDRHGLGHDELQLVAAGGGDEGQRDAGVARRRLDQHGLAGDDLAGFLQRVDHGDADAVLDAGYRVEKLKFRQQVGLDTLFLRDAVQPHQRGVADRVGDVVVDAAAALGLRGGHVWSPSKRL